MMMDFRDNVQKCQEYIRALEEEKHKIQVFQRELPLCLELVTQAIEACKQQLVSGSGTSTTECVNGHSEYSEQTTSDGPVLEEFIPLKRSDSTDDDGDEHEESSQAHVDRSGKKSDWLRSVQLWNPDPPSAPEAHEHQPKRVSVVEVKKDGGAFHPFQKEKGNSGNTNNNKPTSSASACSTAEAAAGGGSSGGNKEEKGGQSQRKARRCWSPELHRRFLHALQQLGGSHVATPKQIRELMKVDGLTNDEVKSHLQKYRLHTRRPTPAIHQNNANPQAPQFVVVGGIWVPPPDYAAVATSGDSSAVATAAPNGAIYAPVATVAAPSSPPPQSSRHKKGSSPSHFEDRGSPSHGGVHSNSPATSTGSHAY